MTLIKVCLMEGCSHESKLYDYLKKINRRKKEHKNSAVFHYIDSKHGCEINAHMLFLLFRLDAWGGGTSPIITKVKEKEKSSHFK